VPSKRYGQHRFLQPADCSPSPPTPRTSEKVLRYLSLWREKTARVMTLSGQNAAPAYIRQGPCRRPRIYPFSTTDGGGRTSSCGRTCGKLVRARLQADGRHYHPDHRTTSTRPKRLADRAG